AATVGCGVVLVLLFWLRRKLRLRLDATLAQTGATTPARALGAKLGTYLGHPLILVCRVIFWAIVFAVMQAYGTVVLRFFPSTRYMSYQITKWLFSESASFGRLVVGYIPNLILLAFIVLITSSLIKLNVYIFGEIRDE